MSVSARIRRKGAGPALAALFLALTLAGVCLIHLPGHVVTPGTVASEHERVLRAEVRGFLSDLHVEPSETVATGDLLLQLESSDLERSVLAAQYGRDVAASEVRLTGDGPRVERLVSENGRDHAERLLRSRLAERERLSIRAPWTGAVVRVPDPAELGKLVEPGTALAVVAAGPPVVHTQLTGEEVGDTGLHRGQRVRFRSSRDPRKTHGGRVARIEPTHASGSTAAAPHFRVTIAFDTDAPDLLYGTTGSVAIRTRPRTLGRRLWRGAVAFAGRLRDGF